MRLDYERYLRDDELRSQLEREVHRARALAVQDFLARSAQALLGHRAAAEDPCHSYASR
ncbi:MAG: hypothetical protein OEV81_05615 [Betaproteobacteria bacterium]|nr:hypothetical protein [Betaproteobacteria bacterium]MDH5221442.1 hypothetical protein [Betaproteobacteria bacterium]MDH5352139.1 hypothetical protein [Betaproteobacteria bacterium]